MNGKPLTGADLVRIAEEHGINLTPARDPLALPDLTTMRVGIDSASKPDRTATITFKVRLGMAAWDAQMRHLTVSLDRWSRALVAARPRMPLRSLAKRQRDALRGGSPHRRRRHGRA